MKRLTKHNVISPFEDSQNIIDDGIITKSNINYVKLVDNIMTQCMLKLKQTLKHSIYSYLWSPNIAFVLLEVILWTLFSTTLNKKCNNTNRISKFIDHMKTLPDFKLFTPIEHSNNSIVKTNLKSSLITLIPINTRCYENLGEPLLHCAVESELDRSMINTIYLRNLICIERQINIHKIIHKYTSSKTISSILISKESTLNLNKISKHLPADQ